MRNVVVTGGGTGIGKAVASMFVAEGERVVLLGRRKNILEEAAAALAGPERVQSKQCDVGDPESVTRAAAWLEDEIGSVDVLVNSAGQWSPSLDRGAPVEAAADHARTVLATNLMGPYLVVHALFPLFRRPGGRIINISSAAALLGSRDIYSASKAGLIGLTYALARELAPDGVTVNAIAPGIVLGTDAPQPTEERLRQILRETLVGRPGAPADIAAAVRYLASPEASFVTGEVHHVNGGWVFGR